MAKTKLTKKRTFHTHQNDLQDKIDQITAEYVMAHPKLMEIAIEKDAALKDRPREYVEHVLTYYPGIIAVAVYNVAHELHKDKTNVPKMIQAIELSKAAQARTGVDIHPDAEIGENLFIDHATGDVIGATTKVGKNTQIMHKVTLGAYSDPKEKDPVKLAHRHPEIGDDCFISVGVEVLGNVKVGNRVQIGPKAMIFGNCITVGNDVKIGTGAKINDKCEIAPGVVIGPGVFIHRGSGRIDTNIEPDSEVFRDETGGLQVIKGTPERYRSNGHGKEPGAPHEWQI